MDPLESVKPWKDTTYYLMLAAAERGHEVFACAQLDLCLRHDALTANATRVETRPDPERPFLIEGSEVVALDAVDCVWERTDPPFNRRYLYASLLLDFLPRRVRVINRPGAVRDWNEKLAALKFPDLTPETLVTARVADLEAFLEECGRVALKPVDGHGGKGIEFCDAADADRASRFARVTDGERRWVIAQRYLAGARDGDKRVLLLDGEPLGAILRLHAEGRELNNLDAGGSAYPTELTPRDVEICRRVGPALRDAGITFAGIDVIDGCLIEVNVTSPTGIQEADRFSGRGLHHRVLERLEREP